LNIKKVREIVKEIERKLEKREYIRKDKYGEIYEIRNNSGKLEVYVLVERSLEPMEYIPAEDPRYERCLKAYGIEKISGNIEENSERPPIILFPQGIFNKLDERFLLAHELGHKDFREKLSNVVFSSNSERLMRSYRAMKICYGLCVFVSQWDVKLRINNLKFFYTLKFKQEINNEPIKNIERHVNEIDHFAPILLDFLTLDEAYAFTTEFLTLLECMENKEISRDYARMQFNLALEWSKNDKLHNNAIRKIFKEFDENSRRWQLTSKFLQYPHASEVNLLIKELYEERENIIKEAKEKLDGLPYETVEKLEEMDKNKVMIEIENNLNALEKLVYNYKNVT
jgi:hypothetical protein